MCFRAGRHSVHLPQPTAGWSLWVKMLKHQAQQKPHPFSAQEPMAQRLTCILWVHMGRVKPKLDEDGNGDSEFEPLHHIGRGLPGQRMDHVASQDHALASTSGHKLGFLP